jgi:hypothetical protein
MPRSKEITKRVAVLAALLAAMALGLAATAQTEATDARSILDRVNAAWQGDSFHGIVALDIVLAGQTKSHKLEIWTLGDDYALIRVLEPEENRNAGYLQVADELWYYSPDIGDVKLPSIGLADALFGAGPSLEDLSHGTLSDDYDVTVEGLDAGWLLSLTPHPDAPVVYGRLELWVSDQYAMERLVYFDQRGGVLQTAVFSDVIEVEERHLATTIVIEDRFGDRTIQRIELAEFDIEIEPGFFALGTFATWGDGE